jgi:hypothetical protein
MAGLSRLVFRLPLGVKEMPYTLEGLLDWTKLDLVVSSTALAKCEPPPIPEPKPLETALEIPYRLILSPEANAGWQHSLVPETFAGRTALWHSRLGTVRSVITKTRTERQFEPAGETNRVPLRAIWSPDFVDHGLLPTDPGPFPAAMTPNDRDQIVILTSGAAGYSVQTGGTLEPFVPTPIHATRMFLSALGGWLNSKGSWPTPPSYTVPGAPAQQLDLTEWVHRATEGRDHYVRIAYEGYLYPFGHRATLVKVSERKFLTSDVSPSVTSPSAYLMQHMYIVVREKEKVYPANSFQFSSREMPFYGNITIKTVVTPDIDMPAPLPGGGSNSFWINVGGKGFPFHLAGADLAGATVDFLADLIFVSDSETNLANVQSQYANSDDQRRCSVKGQKVAYADPSEGDTVLKTDGLFFTTEPDFSQNPAVSFANAPFIPRLDKAQVSVPALEQLLGTTTPVTIELFQPYLANGLDANAGVFADIPASTGQPAVQFSANQSGGFAKPNITLTGISARKGLVAGQASDAAAGTINPAQYFTDVSAQLFGFVPLQNLIPISGLTNAAKNAPEIRTIELPNKKNPTRIVTKIHWSPDLTPQYPTGGGVVTINFNQNGTSALTLEARIERDLTGGPPASNVSGTLTNFLISLAGVIDVNVTSIEFSSKNGSKTTVKAHLPSNNAISFTGPLSFVQALADILPPGVFGGTGPSIELQPTKLRVTYTLGLPSLSVGVFALDHISFLAGMDLPYLDGKPAFEFGFASRSRPFLITVECLGGGGFIHLVIDTTGVQMIEGALEFGGEFSFDIGVASGGVHALAGIYFQLKATSSDITGFVDIGGEVSILGIISISMDLNLSLSYQTSNGKSMVQGRATLSISIHIIFFSISVSVSVEKSFGSSPGDPKVADMITANDWLEYAAAFA